jgi:two-component system sensor histidine kinase DegS
MKKDNKTPELEGILSKTLDVLNDSKKDIFSIYQSSREEMENIKNEIELINQQIEDVINRSEFLEKSNRNARIRLMEVSRDIDGYCEDDIKEAYKKAEETSVKIAVTKEKEEQLRNRRNELEKRALILKNTVDKAENLVSKVGIVSEYLQGELNNLSEHIDDIKQKQKVAMKIIEAQEEE